MYNVWTPEPVIHGAWRFPPPCPACKSPPKVALFKERFGDRFHFIGLPIDPDDTAEKLAQYAKDHQPAYQILSSLELQSREAISQLGTRLLGKSVLPSTFIVSPSGDILAAEAGVPSLSTLARTAQGNQR